MLRIGLLRSSSRPASESRADSLLPGLGVREPESKGVPFLPDPEFGGAKLARVQLMVVASIVRSVAMSRDMNDLQYLRGTSLLQGLKPWLREAERFDEAFVHSFCISTLEEYSVSPLPKCHFYKFSRQVLSLLFPSKEAKTSLNLKIMMSVLKFVAGEFQLILSQVEPKANWSKLLDLVQDCDKTGKKLSLLPPLLVLVLHQNQQSSSRVRYAAV
ncbi:unnamed protein product [Arabidopsis thaliana]|uniref:(thale cress) hypothetical protein n=1 Tax=Arabidopsis thaliana TaxID=3702 RepID=A0A7G2F5M8_ARATH|nr:unnamed protein product [Arabidopsis thaliana]